MANAANKGGRAAAIGMIVGGAVWMVGSCGLGVVGSWAAGMQTINVDASRVEVFEQARRDAGRAYLLGGAGAAIGLGLLVTGIVRMPRRPARPEVEWSGTWRGPGG